MSLFPSPLPDPGPLHPLPIHKCSHFLSHLLIRSPPSCSSCDSGTIYILGVCVICFAMWDGGSWRFWDKACHACCCGKEKEGWCLCYRGHQPAQQPPHNCTLHPFFCTRAVQEQNKDQQLESRSCSHCGHAAQVLQLLSHLVFSLLSALSTTTMLLRNSISFSCDWAKVSPHSCYLVKSFSLTTASLPGSQFWLSQFPGNHCFTACCSGFLPAALLSRFSSSFLPDSGRQWSIPASAVA